MHVWHNLHSRSKYLRNHPDLWQHIRDSLKSSRGRRGYSWDTRDRVIRAVRAGNSRDTVVGVIRISWVRLSRDSRFRDVLMQ